MQLTKNGGNQRSFSQQHAFTIIKKGKYNNNNNEHNDRWNILSEDVEIEMNNEEDLAQIMIKKKLTQ